MIKPVTKKDLLKVKEKRESEILKIFNDVLITHYTNTLLESKETEIDVSQYIFSVPSVEVIVKHYSNTNEWLISNEGLVIKIKLKNELL